MNDPNAKKKRLGEGAVKAIFTCAVIAFALVMFLISDAGRELISGGEAADSENYATPSPDEAPAAERVAPDAFVAALALGGRELAQSAGGQAFDTSELCASSALTLSVTGGAVDAFSLELIPEDMPESLPQDATAIERDIFEDRLAEYELQREDFRELFAACADILDSGDALPSVEAEKLAEMALDTASDGKSREDTLCGFSFSVYASGDDGELVTAILSYR